MEITLKGDAKMESIPSLKDKALRINLNENIYGTFAFLFQAGCKNGVKLKTSIDFQIRPMLKRG